MRKKPIDDINNIMSKCHGIFTENFIIIFFQVQEKLETCLINCRIPSFGDDINVTFIS